MVTEAPAAEDEVGHATAAWSDSPYSPSLSCLETEITPLDDENPGVPGQLGDGGRNASCEVK